MFCKCKTVLLLFQNIINKELFFLKNTSKCWLNLLFMWIKMYFLKYFKTFDAGNRSYFIPNLGSH